MEAVRTRMRQASANFENYYSHFVDKKAEHYEIKRMNDLERAQIRKEQKQANAFKFTKMSKKVPFLPALNQTGYLENPPVTSIDHNVAYMPGRDKEKLVFPDKVFERTKKFKLNPAFGSYLSRPVG